MPSDAWEELKPRLAQCERSLNEFIHVRISGMPPILAEAMNYSLFAGGKRLRPLLCGLACEAMGGRFEQAIPAGVAVEMIHTYSLIHDDLPAMDDDDLRRGRPTCHNVYGEALAILAGDALQAMAFEIVANSYQPPIGAVMVRELARGSGAAGMVGGQVLDLIADGKIKASGGSQSPEDSQLEAIHRLKTGALFEATMALGAYASREEVDCPDDEFGQRIGRLTDYARSFGLLFQVTDDLLDVTSTAEMTGKLTGKDSAKGKLTYPGLLGVEASRVKAKELAETCVNVANRFDEGGRWLAELARFVERRDR